MTETEVKNAIKGMLKRLNIFYFSVGASMFNRKGISDIVGLLPTGIFFCIEVKNTDWSPPRSTNIKKYKHYVNQRVFHDAVRDSNGIAMFATCVDDVIGGLRLKNRFIT